MYCYKINNSYTVYVYTEYINDCIAKGRNRSSAACTPSKTTSRAKAKKPQKHVTPPALNTRVSHKRWGIGKLVEANTRGIMTIAFANHLVKFVYPDAFNQGFLVRV